MARLDVYRLPGGALALDRQSEQLDHLASRFTVPLVPEDELTTRIPGLHPLFEIEATSRVMATHLAGAVPTRVLNNRAGWLAEHENVVQRALDMLTGSY